MYNKKEKNQEEQKEFDELKKERSATIQRRIDIITSEKKEAEYLKSKAEEEKARIEEENEELKKQLLSKPRDVAKSTLKIGDKEWYTDETLQRMIESKEISETDAWKYKSQRDKEEIIEEIERRREGKEQKETDQSLRQKDKEWVRENYPSFQKGNEKYDPNDELYKLADELFQEGYSSDPQGVSKAIKRAEKILGKNPPIDVSDDLSLRRSRGEDRNFGKNNGDKTTLSDDEKEIAHRMYVMSGTMNPKTGRVYTTDEAHIKALEGKKKRLESRRIM